MAGERLEAANLGWHGLAGDRRLALRRVDDRGGMPWLTASKLPDLLLFTPQPRRVSLGRGRHETGANQEREAPVVYPEDRDAGVVSAEAACPWRAQGQRRGRSRITSGPGTHGVHRIVVYPVNAGLGMVWPAWKTVSSC